MSLDLSRLDRAVIASCAHQIEVFRNGDGSLVVRSLPNRENRYSDETYIMTMPKLLNGILTALQELGAEIILSPPISKSADLTIRVPPKETASVE